jgi:hypothetical protein
MAIPATITYFVTYEQLRVLLHDNHMERTGEMVQPLWIPLVSGAIARTWAVTIVNPLELIRTKMQSKKLSYKGNILKKDQNSIVKQSNIHFYLQKYRALVGAWWSLVEFLDFGWVGLLQFWETFPSQVIHQFLITNYKVLKSIFCSCLLGFLWKSETCRRTNQWTHIRIQLSRWGHSWICNINTFTLFILILNAI